jgi:glycine cleavage system H lipoate-binding protein
MTQKVYKTAQGKTVDMGRLMLQNEKTRAVGNMKVNARGDLVDDMNNVISSRPQQVNKQYNKQIQNPKGNQ